MALSWDKSVQQVKEALEKLDLDHRDEDQFTKLSETVAALVVQYQVKTSIVKELGKERCERENQAITEGSSEEDDETTASSRGAPPISHYVDESADEAKADEDTTAEVSTEKGSTEQTNVNPVEENPSPSSAPQSESYEHANLEAAEGSEGPLDRLSPSSLLPRDNWPLALSLTERFTGDQDAAALYSESEKDDDDDSIPMYTSSRGHVWRTDRPPPLDCYNCGERHWRFQCPYAIGRSGEDEMFRSSQSNIDGQIVPNGFGFHTVRRAELGAHPSLSDGFRRT